MCPGESAGRSAGQGGPDGLASAILARIAGGDLPAGSELSPERLAVLYKADPADITEALRLLAAHGAAVQSGAQWHVRSSQHRPVRDVLHWLVPALRGVVTLAVARITPAEAARLLAAYDRYAGLAGDGTLATRAGGYRQLVERLAEASGSRFHALSITQLLDQAEPLLTRMVAHQMQSRRVAEPDDELGRLAQAMMRGHGPAASAALEDHLILLRRYLDSPEPIRP
jgi:DNA-binding GntR family transcriptional regulator